MTSYETAILRCHDGNILFHCLPSVISQANLIKGALSTYLVLPLVLTYLFLDPYLLSCQHSQRTYFRPMPKITVMFKNLIKRIT